MMNLLHWRLLVAVAEAGNISRAAERVGITQSGASQAIAQLEAALGFRVFSRERRHVGVTALGGQVIEHARAMLERLDAIRVLADDSQGLSGGRIRLASFPSVISTLLPGLLRDFQRRHPGIELVALEGTDEEVEDWLAAGTVELGVVLNPAPSRAAAVLGHDAWVAVLPASHPLGRRASESGVTLEELAAQPFILATGGCAVNGQRLVEQAGLHLSDLRVTVRDWASACVLVREGMGVALVPESTLPDEQRGLRVMPLVPVIHREFGLVCSDAGKASRPVQALLEGLLCKDGSPGNR
ncbi:transcriptional regulator, LysR family protein [Pandoraea communis]|uniref:Transcriptional regulator, LysR family protein n=1 Tax=Pandoraea communis TaxID=2508297 RepID=A0A5E4W313_9BURK|nr:LysR family transcriptional regulator [Pandoraea communis]VVE18249.1 transcriptional regulator, LysR family protein [Pandoraea communis]